MTEIEKLEKKLKQAHLKQDEKRARLKFKCLCGAMHQIKSCEVIQTLWSDDGSFPMHGELQIICPKKNIRNRLLYDSYYEVDWKNRDSYDYSAEIQFKGKYKHLFKKVIEGYSEEFKTEWNNNYYIDQNHKKFGLKIKGYEGKS